MSKIPVKSNVAVPRFAKRPSTSIASTTYRVSQAQSLRMRSFDKKVEAAEAKKAKAAAAKQVKSVTKSGVTDAS